MAALRYALNRNGLGQEVPPTPQEIQHDQTQTALNQAAYDQAGQAPPQPNRWTMPLLGGGLSTWLVIIVLLLISFKLFAHLSISAGAHVGGISAVAEVG